MHAQSNVMLSVQRETGLTRRCPLCVRVSAAEEELRSQASGKLVSAEQLLRLFLGLGYLLNDTRGKSARTEHICR